MSALDALRLVLGELEARRFDPREFLEALARPSTGAAVRVDCGLRNIERRFDDAAASWEAKDAPPLFDPVRREAFFQREIPF